MYFLLKRAFDLLVSGLLLVVLAPLLVGLAQISGRGALAREGKVELDVRYVEWASLGLDAWILLLTFLRVFAPRGIYEETCSHAEWTRGQGSSEPSSTGPRGERPAEWFIMKRYAVTGLILLSACSAPARALEPTEILVVANAENAASMRLARYFCEKRGIPSGNVLPVSLGTPLRDNISRADYDAHLAGPIRRVFLTRKDLGGIKCLVTTYGIPFRVGPREPLSGYDAQLRQLRQRLEQEKKAAADLEGKGQTESASYRTHRLGAAQIQADIDRIMGNETGAAVDSELSLVLHTAYELYRWQPNALRNPAAPQPFKTLMVARLDGPSYGIAKGLIDKALAAEAKGLTGTAYIDSRGLVGKDLYSYCDQSLRDLALLVRLRTSLAVQEERTPALFPPGSCPRTALYCGWYSVGQYVEAFEFVEGAVGFHIASFEAANLRDPNSTQWCPALLRHGITATLGPVAEPYLHAFPEPKAFFGALFDGHCLVEAYYLTQPFNSWQLLLIGDPLYRPFKPGPTPPEEKAAPEPVAGRRRDWQSAG